MKKLFNNSLKSAIIFLCVAVATAFLIQFVPQRQKRLPSDRIKEASQKLVELQDKMIETLGFISKLKSDKEIRDFFIQSGKEITGFSYYVLQDSAVKNWSDNEPAITDSVLFKVKNGDFLKLSNGDFLGYSINESGRKIIGLILIKNRYEYENKYLVNKFNSALGLSREVRISISGDTLFLPGKVPAYILNYDSITVRPPAGWIVGIYFLICVLFLISIYLFSRYFSKSIFLTGFFVLIIIAFRSLMIFFDIPSSLYEHGIFSPAYYASSFYFNSLGDMLLNVALFLVFSVSLYENIKIKKHKLFLFILWLAAAIAIHLLIRGLVINSRISFELSTPADINIYSILAFTCISILLLCFLFLTAALLKAFSKFSLNGRNAWIGISICAIYTAIALTGMNKEKEYETRKLIAQKAEMRQDHIAEYLFKEQINKISDDEAILDLIHSENYLDDKIGNYISQKYFDGYLSKFEINVITFAARDSVVNNSTLEYYRQLAAKGKPTVAKNLFFLNNEAGRSSYISILPMNEGAHKHVIVIMMSARFLKETKGFPELFLSGRLQDNSPSDIYSLARYSDNSLVYEYGDYIYPLTAKAFPKTNEEYFFFNLNGHSHLIHKIGGNSFIIVSKPEGKLLGVLTLFS